MELDLKLDIDIVLGGKYRVLDKDLNSFLNVQIVELNEVELIYKIIYDSKDNVEKFQYRELDEIEIIEVLEIEKAIQLNNNSIFSISNDEIKGIIGRKDIELYSKNNFIDFNINKDTVIISVTDPKRKEIDKKILNKFKDSLSIQFYDINDIKDIEEYKTSSDWKFVPITISEAKEILDFIIKHKNDNFLINCEAGKSRSSGIGLAIECILKFDGDMKEFSYNPSDILNHHRYEPNMLVFKKIMSLYND